MAASKSGNNIQVDGVGNTLSSITADIADTTFIEEVSSGVFRVKSDVTRYLQIMNGGELTIGNSEDYSTTEELQFESSVNDRNRLYVYHGSILNMYGNTTLNFSSGGARMGPCYLYGQINVLGDDIYQPEWYRGYRLYIYNTSNDNASYDNDIFHFEKMKNDFC